MDNKPLQRVAHVSFKKITNFQIINCVDAAVTTDFIDILLCPNSIVLKARLKLTTDDIELVYQALLRNKHVHVLIRSYA